jgi:hypothetical protein
VLELGFKVVEISTFELGVLELGFEVVEVATDSLLDDQSALLNSIDPDLADKVVVET